MKQSPELPEAIKKIAKRELREDKTTREQSLVQLRTWVTKNEDLKNVRTDDHFLLRFLRAKKFSVPMAQQTILKYFNIRRCFPHLSSNLDILEPKLNGLLSDGYVFAAPKPDKHGRRVVFINAKGLNPKLYSSSDQSRAHYLTYECLMDDAQTQVTGIVEIGDFSGITAAHITNWNPTEFARILKWTEHSLPIRHKEVHLINVPSTLKWLIDFVKNRLSNKIKNRVMVYSDDKDLDKVIDPECLPLEFGGKMPKQEMIELWKQELIANRDIVMTLDKAKLLSDRGITNKSSYNSEKTTSGPSFVSQIESLQGSFRKLEFD